MGYYLNQTVKGHPMGTSAQQKHEAMIADGAKEIEPPQEWKEGLFCLVDNFMFAAVGYAYSPAEMREFLNVTNRPTRWYHHPEAVKLAA